jgi:DNA-binding NarL/FixJ family response regulator
MNACPLAKKDCGSRRFEKAKLRRIQASINLAKAVKEERMAIRAWRGNRDGANLSRREIEVLELVRMRRANKEIAAELNISLRTVKFHVSALLRKFGATSRNQI